MCCPCSRDNLKQLAISGAVLAAWAGLALTIMLGTFHDKVWITKDLDRDDDVGSHFVHFEDGGKALFACMIVYNIIWCLVLVLVAASPHNSGIQLTNLIMSALGFVVQLVAGLFMFVMAAAVNTDLLDEANRKGSFLYGVHDKLKNPRPYFVACYIPAFILCVLAPALAHGSRLQRLESGRNANQRGVMANTQGGYVPQQYSQQPPAAVAAQNI